MSALVLKGIAVLSMLLDHIGMVFPNVAFRAVGRLALPLFAFLIANGYKYTKNVRKYAARLFVFAWISEIPFDLLIDGKVSYFRMLNVLPIPIPKLDNVYFTLLFGLLFLILRDFWEKRAPRAAWFLSLCTFFTLGVFAQICGTDYGIVGVALVAVFGSLDFKTQKAAFYPAFVLAMSWRLVCAYITRALLFAGIPCAKIPLWSVLVGSGAIGLMDKLEPIGILSIFAILAYNKTSGMPEGKWQRKALQYAFYAFYPLHLYLLYLIARG